MKSVVALALLSLMLLASSTLAADAPWVVSGELTSIDAPSRRGVCRHEGTNIAVPFEIADDRLLARLGGPGAAPSAARGTRLIFEFTRLDTPGQYRLTAVRCEAEEMITRDERLHVDVIDTVRWPRLKCSRGKSDRSELFETDYWLEVSPETRYWKQGQPAKFDDIQLGTTLVAQTRGVGFGRVRVATDVYLDRESWDRSQRP